MRDMHNMQMQKDVKIIPVVDIWRWQLGLLEREIHLKNIFCCSRWSGITSWWHRENDTQMHEMAAGFDASGLQKMWNYITSDKSDSCQTNFYLVFRSTYQQLHRKG